MTAPSRPARPTLNRDLSEFLIELSIALHKHAIYPPGHPSLAPAAMAVARRADFLLGERPSLSVGVARNQLIIEGVATDPKHPVLAELASRLHRHHLGAMTMYKGVTPTEVADVLKTIAVEPDRSGKPLGLGDRSRLEAWQHIRLHSLTYERLELIDEKPSEQDAPQDQSKVRSAQLWLGLARAALAGQLGGDQAVSTTPAVIAQALDSAPKTEGYDQVIVGYLLQIAEELKAAGGSGAADLRRRTSRLIRAMRPETLRRLLDMGGDFSQRRRFVLDATHGVAVDAVIELVRAAADASHQTVSHSLVRMLSKLAAHAEQGVEGVRANADLALRGQVEHLLQGWTLEDPNPGAYGHALQAMSRSRAIVASSSDEAATPEDERLVQMALELDEIGPRLGEEVVRLRDTGRLGVVFHTLDQAPAGSTAATAVRQMLCTVETLEGLLLREPIDFVLVDRVVEPLGIEAAGPLLDALSGTENRAVRRALLDRLVALPGDLGSLLIPRLKDERWYVRRNLLQLMGRLPHLPEGFSPADYAVDTDERVRRESVRLQLSTDAEMAVGVANALADTDDQTVRRGLLAATEHPDVLPAVLSQVIKLALDERADSGVRVSAIRALRGSNAPEVLNVLLRWTEGGRSIFRRQRLAAATPELAAALAVMAERWRSDPRAQTVLERAAASSDPMVRAAASGKDTSPA
ncbi:MAG TPA: hypothetical protein VN848_09545 [Gemmatimonadales bacterium]|nr:hypothetical protein [Gemmatimonadales bacterium]